MAIHGDKGQLRKFADVFLPFTTSKKAVIQIGGNVTFLVLVLPLKPLNGFITS